MCKCKEKQKNKKTKKKVTNRVRLGLVLGQQVQLGHVALVVLAVVELQRLLAQVRRQSGVGIGQKKKKKKKKKVAA